MIKVGFKDMILGVCFAGLFYLAYKDITNVDAKEKTDDGWDRSYTVPVVQKPVEQMGLSPEEFADLDTVKILHTYRVEDRFAGIAYYDKATNMVCHVVTTATLLDPKAIDCKPFTGNQK